MKSKVSFSVSLIKCSGMTGTDSFFVEFVNLFLELNFRRFSLFCLIFRVFDCKASYFHFD